MGTRVDRRDDNVIIAMTPHEPPPPLCLLAVPPLLITVLDVAKQLGYLAARRCVLLGSGILCTTSCMQLIKSFAFTLKDQPVGPCGWCSLRVG